MTDHPPGAAIDLDSCQTKREAGMSTVQSTTYEAPGQSGSPVKLAERYENFIGGEWIAPTTGEYRENLTPSTGAGRAVRRGRSLRGAGHRAGARRGPRGQGRLGGSIAGRARRCPERRRGCDRGEP